MNEEVGIEISELPPPVESVRAPSYFNPSNFADLLQCPLSVLHGLDDHELLPPNPHAILGMLIHKVMDRVRRSSPTSEEAAVEMAIAIFDEILMVEERRLNKDPATRALVPLRRAVGRPAWRNRLAYLKAWAAAAATAHGHSDGSFQTPEYGYARSASNTPRARVNTVRTGTERPLAVPELRLSGRPDCLERDLDGTIQVTDFKTGPVSDREGRPDDKYALQVRLYALMLERVEPGARVRLWLEGAQRIEIPWDDTIQSAVEETLWEISTLLPEGKVLAAETIANTGPQCWKCPIRHRCSLYLREAPRWWGRSSIVEPVAPFDVWGRVLNTEMNEGRIAGMEIRDAADRMVRLSGLESRTDAISHPGAAVWFFNLEPSENLPAYGVYRHPRNYQEQLPVAHGLTL